MRRKVSVLFVLLSLLIVVGCSYDNIVAETSPYVSYTVDLQVVQSGYNGEWCWFHPRAAKCGDNSTIVMLMQPWITSHSDFYQFLSEMKTFDEGEN